MVPFARTEYFRKSFSVRASNLMNALNINEFEESKIYIMKKTVFKHFLTQDLNDWENRVSREGIVGLRVVYTVPDL